MVRKSHEEGSRLAGGIALAPEEEASKPASERAALKQKDKWERPALTEQEYRETAASIRRAGHSMSGS